MYEHNNLLRVYHLPESTSECELELVVRVAHNINEEIVCFQYNMISEISLTSSLQTHVLPHGVPAFLLISVNESAEVK